MSQILNWAELAPCLVSFLQPSLLIMPEMLTQQNQIFLAWQEALEGGFPALLCRKDFIVFTKAGQCACVVIWELALPLGGSKVWGARQTLRSCGVEAK